MTPRTIHDGLAVVMSTPSPRAHERPGGKGTVDIESFRSISVLEEIVRIETATTHLAMSPEEAFQLLRRVSPDVPHANGIVQGLSMHEVLEGIESACWRRFASGLPSPTRVSSRPTRTVGGAVPLSPTHTSPARSSSGMTWAPVATAPTARAPSPSLAVPYAQLYHGLVETVRDKEMAIAALEQQIHETTLRTQSLPQRIEACEQTIAKTINSFVALSATALDCTTGASQSAAVTAALLAAPSKSGSTRTMAASELLGGDGGRQQSQKSLQTHREDSERLAARVKSRIGTLHRRKDLRLWACRELRAVINDHMTRASELKKAITVILGDVKREELANKVKAKRMEEATAGTEGAGHGGHGHGHGRRMTFVGVPAAAATSESDTGATGAATTPLTPGAHPSPPMTAALVNRDRLTALAEQRASLQEALRQRREQIRRRTEEIFDVRNEVKRLADDKAALEAEARDLEGEMAHIQRACTPRPEWGELHRAILATTIANQNSAPHSRISLNRGASPRRQRHGRQWRGRGTKMDVVGAEATGGDDLEADPDEDDPEALLWSTEERLGRIVASKWSTIEKVQALVDELTRIRMLYHGGEGLTAEQEKLDQLHQEIQRTLQQLATVRSQSRGNKAV